MGLAGRVQEMHGPLDEVFTNAGFITPLAMKDCALSTIPQVFFFAY